MNSQTGNRADKLLKQNEWVFGILKIFGFWKDRVDVQSLKHAATFFGSDQSKSVWVSTGRYEFRSYTPQNAPRDVGGGRQYSMVSIGFYNLCLSPHVGKDWRLEKIPPNVSESTVGLYYYYYYYWYHYGYITYADMYAQPAIGWASGKTCMSVYLNIMPVRLDTDNGKAIKITLIKGKYEYFMALAITNISSKRMSLVYVAKTSPKVLISVQRLDFISTNVTKKDTLVSLLNRKSNFVGYFMPKEQ